MKLTGLMASKELVHGEWEIHLLVLKEFYHKHLLNFDSNIDIYGKMSLNMNEYERYSIPCHIYDELIRTLILRKKILSYDY
jgi:hypothetical protein